MDLLQFLSDWIQEFKLSATGGIAIYVAACTIWGTLALFAMLTRWLKNRPVIKDGDSS